MIIAGDEEVPLPELLEPEIELVSLPELVDVELEPELLLIVHKP